ncbi:tape measure protein [Mesorhizobium sp. CGMCC 1.15528]|uniref:Tape measure protein n=1 Tax=Mesorhizobium zhangyense TaxID=1776730 RepID=A0A7C9VB94_9HYPH|nr:tape measure protein [Mesorhizobium zhangyense]NGN45184.1 tape measure protein [Mesorhizobium zhangyense]
MATDIERLVVQLSADFKQFQNAMNKAQRDANRGARGIERRFQQMNRNISSQFTSVGAGLTKAFAVAGGVRGIQSLLDSATRIDNALKVAGLSGAELEKVYARLRDSAVANAAPIEDLVTLYSRASMSAKDLGVSQDELLKFTDNVALSLRVSGKSAQEASGALLQLSQALGNGVVQAEEYNSLIDGAQPLLQAVAAGLKETGGSVSALTRLVKDGQITSEVFFRAFEAGASILQDKVANSVLTTSHALENVKTAMIDGMREFAKGSLAATDLADAFQKMADHINSINFESFGEEVRKLIGWLQSGAEFLNGFSNALNNLASAAGRQVGADKIGEWAAGTSVGQAIGMQSNRTMNDRFGGGSGAVSDTSKAAVDAYVNRVYGSVIERSIDSASKTGRLPAASGGVTPVSMADFDAAPKKGGKGKGGKGAKERADEYERLAERITDSTAATIAETEAQRQLNPLIDDYGYAVEKARAEQELLNAAKEAGKKVTPQLRAEIAALANQYALATVEAAKLGESQDKIRERAEDMRDFQKDLTRGIVDGFIEGKKAADIFADALSKIGNKLLDIAFDTAFGGGSEKGFGFVGKLFGFASGGYTGSGGRYQPAGIVHKGEYVVPKSTVDKVGVSGIERMLAGYANGGLVGAPSMPRIHAPANQNNGPSMTFAPVIDARGADVAAVDRLERVVAKQQQEFEARVVNTVRRAQKTRNL